MKAKKQVKYSPEFKETVLKEAETEPASVVAKRHGLKPYTIQNWRNYAKKKAEPKGVKKVAKKTVKKPNDSDTIEVLKTTQLGLSQKLFELESKNSELKDLIISLTKKLLT